MREVVLVRELKSFGVPGFSLPFHDRVAMLVEMVGGLVEAAKIAKVDRDTINNWRKEGARVPILGLLPLAIAAQVTLDWIATGYQQRPDIEALGWNLGMNEAKPATGPAPGFTQLLPLRPEPVNDGRTRVERWTPSEIAVSTAWLSNRFGLTDETARYMILEENGMAPVLPAGTMVMVDSRSGQELKSGIYLLEVGDEVMARRLYVGPDRSLFFAADADPKWRFGVHQGTVQAWRVVWWCFAST